ncbi:hypothetical protein [Actinoplanes subtropicus]|uniref:hypothetical protein n=1 Tax=Actinoplanes subtropicus TaxID=543632 RepID=UPI0004C3EF28|nr:hypothetical protein [Actinoplanes subtropicus]
MAEKPAGTVRVGVGLDVVEDGFGERLVAVGRAEDREGTADGEGDGDGEGGRTDANGEGEGEVGSTTVGCWAASTGPTARTAIQTTSMTRTAAAALRKIRAGPSGRAVCFAGKRGHPSRI